ncbi:1,3-beta-glucanase [Microbacterium sp. Sa4CUA7]|uniref:glucan endo-1,3-beta-D-glucosidase n=1 Tax=Microbacterium pullorum TaxID=2762236 RepID=A0ABR8S0D0_9MICO|nr:glycosyl hydrolase [Microbacterium pullorum]MBD7956927.1 1,3-beta-glucanase [Microbacterium pullorum]
MNRRRGATVLLAAAVLATAGCTAEPPGQPVSQPWAPEAASAATVSALPVERVAEGLAPPRLADGVVPPTNRWYSGLVFGATPQPVYPFPLAFAAADAGFTVDLPQVSATAQTIAASFAGGLQVGMPADRFEAVRVDAVSVTLRWWDGGDAVGDVTIAEGSPVVGFTAARATDLTPAVTLEPAGDGLWTATADETTFGVVSPDATWSGSALTVPAGAHALWFALPDGADLAQWADALDAPVSGVAVEIDTGTDTSSTRLTYTGTESTVLVPFPGHEADAAACGLGTFRTAYGDAVACAGTELEWSVPAVAARASFDLSAADDATLGTIATQIAADLAATPALPADTYHGGKALARLGALLTLAREVGDADLVSRVADRLWQELAPWAETDGCTRRDTRCFVYDDALRMVVGRAPTFGAEEGNDHHFHYGYYLSAAAALVAAQPDKLEPLQDVMDALAADIAGSGGDLLPPLRVFDPYRGHSWASGLSPFADGNNQESSSEAVAAWDGLAQWASARDDAAVEATATWLLSAEVAAARARWLEPDPATLADGFAHTIVSLTWGGKRDYATWFSPEPSAILGIQLLPLTPVALDYLGADPQRVAANVADAGPTALTGPLGEYVLMYSALAGDAQRTAAAAALATLPEVDGGTSKSVMLAWLAAAAQSSKDP